VVDCDVIEADGGTRTAAITGGFVALALAVQALLRSGGLARAPELRAVAAVSVGIVNGTDGVARPVLDLPYVEDSRAAVDLNVVMLATRRAHRGARHGRAGELLAGGAGRDARSGGARDRPAGGGAAGGDRGAAMRRLVLASANLHKLAELAAMLAKGGR
jgi:hypothetical protein